MSAVSRVSAFAKRRRLNDDSVVRTSESEGSSTTSIRAKEVNLRKIAVRHTDLLTDVQQTLSRDEVDQTDGTNGASKNSFEPLVDANAVSFTGTREIEQLDGNGCRIRLSKGQKCSIHGIARIWVREGIIHVAGALLAQSVHVHTVFFSPTGSFTDIVAESKMAEFELDSIRPSHNTFPSAANLPGKLGESARNGMMSFRVLGQTQDDDLSSLRMTNDIDIQVRKKLPHIRNAMHMREPRVLICGKRSADTYRASISLINQLTTHSTETLVSSIMNGIAFLDLDFTAPAFSAPGTISVAILQKPVLGPSYTQPLQHRATESNMLAAIQYIGAVELSEIPKIDLNCISTLLLTAKEAVKDKLLVIRTGSWLAYMTPSERSQIQKLLRVDLAICIDANKASPHYEVAQAFSERSLPSSSDIFFHIPMSPSATSSLPEHKLMLQSHFRLCEFMDDVPLWYHDSIPDTGKRRLVLSLAKSRNEISFLQVRGGMLRPQDVSSAIHQNLVVIVATWTTKDMESSLSNHHRDLSQDLPTQPDNARTLLELRPANETQILHYIGLAYVEEIETQTKSITLNTSINIEDISRYTSAGHEVGLVLEKPGSDGRFGRHLLLT